MKISMGWQWGLFKRCLKAWVEKIERSSCTHWSISLCEIRSILFWTSTMGMSPHSSSTWKVNSSTLCHSKDTKRILKRHQEDPQKTQKEDFHLFPPFPDCEQRGTVCSWECKDTSLGRKCFCSKNYFWGENHKFLWEKLFLGKKYEFLWQQLFLGR